MSDIITNTTNTNDCKVFKVYLSKYTATNISSNIVINNSTVNGINVTNALNNLQNTKLDKGTYVGTAQDLYERFEEKIEAGNNYIPKVGNGASGKVLVPSDIGEIYGKIGIGLSGIASEKLEVNGNIKAIDFKGQSIKFNLQASITPTPNTLVPKTDGSGLVWYDNNSVPKDLGGSGGNEEKLDKFSKIENITVSQDTNYVYIKGDVLHVIKNGNMGNTTPGSAKVTLNGYLEITNGILIEKTDTINNPGHNSGVGGFNFMPYDETIYYKGLYIGFYIRIDKSINPSPFWTNGYGVVCIMLTYADYVGSSKAIGAIRL